MHAESVLFVDHGEGEVREDHILLEQRMGADQDGDIAGVKRLQDLFARATLLTPREQREADSRPRQRRLERRRMLPRQERRRRHQSGLGARLDGDQHGEERDRGLAAADVALEKTEHADAAREIGFNLGHGRALPRGQAEGKHPGDRFAQAPVADHGPPAPAPG